MTTRFLIVAEDELGFVLARDLCDRVIAERGADWLRDLWDEEPTRETQREWTNLKGLKPPEAPSAWSSWPAVKALADELSIRVHGHGEKAERLMARKAVAVAAKLSPKAEALFLVHDTDGDEEVRRRLREGASVEGELRGPLHFKVLAVTPHPESEAWVVAGAIGEAPELQRRREEERQRLGFNPVVSPERLTSNRATDKRDAKSVCKRLFGEERTVYEHWEQVHREAPLQELEKNGASAGLREYTRDVEEVILPLLGNGGPR